MSSKKYDKYQDYVIKDGQFIGEFEQLYKDFDDPWNHTMEGYAEGVIPTDKAIAIQFLRKIKARRVLELGCGLGQFTNEIQQSGFDVLGLDVSETAIAKAKNSYPECQFKTADILDFHLYKQFRPDVVVMAEITWYVLDKLDHFISHMRENYRDVYLIHMLVSYPIGAQEYGRDKFTSLDEIMSYFDMNYIEWGEVRKASSVTTKTFFLGAWNK
jgi:SAM-dependent methyltransferase